MVLRRANDVISRLVGEAVGLCLVWLCKSSGKLAGSLIASAASPGRAGVCGAATIPGRGGYTSSSSSNHLALLLHRQEE